VVGFVVGILLFAVAASSGTVRVSTTNSTTEAPSEDAWDMITAPMQRAICPHPVDIHGQRMSCDGRVPSPDPTVRP